MWSIGMRQQIGGIGGFGMLALGLEPVGLLAQRVARKSLRYRFQQGRFFVTSARGVAIGMDAADVAAGLLLRLDNGEAIGLLPCLARRDRGQRLVRLARVEPFWIGRKIAIERGLAPLLLGPSPGGAIGRNVLFDGLDQRKACSGVGGTITVGKGREITRQAGLAAVTIGPDPSAMVGRRARLAGVEGCERNPCKSRMVAVGVGGKIAPQAFARTVPLGVGPGLLVRPMGGLGGSDGIELALDFRR